jgi:hypothetical protein
VCVHVCVSASVYVCPYVYLMCMYVSVFLFYHAGVFVCMILWSENIPVNIRVCMCLTLCSCVCVYVFLGLMCMYMCYGGVCMSVCMCVYMCV